ncbi:MAG: GPR endopeptidase [Oscillospiraceae bacterium]|nr:GPR endopeptidase [Oscillospiraceae bacterium]
MNHTVRTDLAMERLDFAKKSHGLGRGVDGVTYKRKIFCGIAVHSMEIISDSASDILRKPIGLYYTISLKKLLKRCDNSFIHGVNCIAEVLRSVLPKGNRFLIACLGNPQITPDAIGPLCAKQVMVTRHLKTYMPETFSDFAEVSLVCPGVLGTTGIESASLVKGAVDAVQPDVVIVVDALTASSMDRLCCTIQICNTGIEPGSGVGNRRYALNRDTLGVPVIAVGMPTIVDVSTLLFNSENSGEGSVSLSEQMMVTPREIDALVSDSAKLIAYGINTALHNDLSLEDIDLFIS